MPTSSRNIAVVGLGDFGTALARELCGFGDHVLGIDIIESRVTALGDDVDLVAQADARDIRALEELGVQDYDAVVVAIGENMEASLVVTMNALELGCDSLWAKAQGPMHERILRKLGVNSVVLPEQHAGRQVAERVHNPLIQDFLKLSEESYIAKVSVSDPMKGKKIEQINLFESGTLTCLAVERDGELQDQQSVELEDADILVLYGNRESMQRLRKLG